MGEDSLINQDSESLMPERTNLSVNRSRKLLKRLGLISIVLPCIAASAFLLFGMSQSIAQTASVESTSFTSEYFDPSLGAQEVASENGRALVVVHEGHAERTYPFQFEDDVEYQNYLRKLDAREQMYLSEGDVVIRVVQQADFAKGDYLPEDNVLYMITGPNVGYMYGNLVFQGVEMPQSWDSLEDLLRQAGVGTVEIAGEKKDACARDVAKQFEQKAYKVEWCPDCVYPLVKSDEMNYFPLAPIDISP